MADEDRFARWARRRVSHPQAAEAQSAPSSAPGPTTPPAPPPGYAYAWNPQYGALVLVPTTMASASVAMVPAPAPAWTPPPRSPGVVPYMAQPPAIMAPRPGAPMQMGRVLPMAVNTCQLVKPGNRDTYAELLGQLPDLVPDMGVSPGEMSELSAQEIAQFSGVISGESGQPLLLHDQPAAYPTMGRGAPTAGTKPMELGAAAMPVEKVG